MLEKKDSEEDRREGSEMRVHTPGPSTRAPQSGRLRRDAQTRCKHPRSRGWNATNVCSTPAIASLFPPSLPPAFHSPSPPPPPRLRSLCPATCSSTFPTRLRLGRPPATMPTPSTPSLRGSTSARSSHPKRSSHLLRGQRHPSSDRPGYHLQGSEVTLTLMIALAIHHQPG